MAEHRITTPVSDEVIAKLHAGDKVFISGYILTGRDPAHKKLIDLIKEVKEALKKNKAVYLASSGGTGALISKSIVASEVVAYPELGPEAIIRLKVQDFPCIVINDMYGGDLYEEGTKKTRGG